MSLWLSSLRTISPLVEWNGVVGGRGIHTYFGWINIASFINQSFMNEWIGLLSNNYFLALWNCFKTGIHRFCSIYAAFCSILFRVKNLIIAVCGRVWCTIIISIAVVCCVFSCFNSLKLALNSVHSVCVAAILLIWLWLPSHLLKECCPFMVVW